MGRRIWLVTLAYFYVVRSSPITGKAFFCRDPDTGKLHSINSTWQSSTFCGNYTCKLRERNLTDNFKPFRQINITNVDIFNNTKNASKVKANITTVTAETNEDHKKTNEARDSDRLATVLHMQKVKSSEVAERNLPIMVKSGDSGDRYLTESEIKTISKILHTVKKSDLDAIVEIYNLAQDIYKEMDTPSATNLEQVILETKSEEKPKFKHDNYQLDKNSHISYWYEPLNNVKGKAIDMTQAGSNVVNTLTKTTTEPTTYFKGALSHSDFRKLPYYYPISSFQRMSSYVHGVPNYNPEVKKAPCKTKMNAKGPAHNGIIKRPFAVETQKIIQPSVLLPYPFSYIHHYNITNSPYSQNLWGQYIIPKNNRNPGLKTNYFQVSNNAVLINPYHSDDTLGMEQKPLLKEDKKRNLDMPQWQTKQLDNTVIEEVKANIDDKLIKSFPFRKKVSLEKVGKVIKLDELERVRRDIKGDGLEKQKVEKVEKVEKEENSDESVADERFEVYLEKTTCHSDTQPGYFRVGNMTQPYPKCCPQRIK